MKTRLLTLALLLLGGCARIISPTTYAASSYTLSGVVQLGRVQGATVRVYDLAADGTEGSLLATTTTNSNGEYRFTLPQNTGSVIIKSSGGTFNDEAEQVQKNASDLSSIASGGSTIQAPLTPMSTLEVDRVKSLLSSNPDLSQAKSTAKAEVARLFGLSVADLSVLPDTPNALSLDSSKVKSALAVAAFSHFVKDLYVPKLTSSNKLSSVLTAMKEDFKTDGKLDGTYNSDTAKKVAAVWTSKMSSAKRAAAANSHLDFLDQSSLLIDSVSGFDPGNTTSGHQGDGYYLNGVKTSLNNDGDGVWLGTCFEGGEDTGSLMEGTGSCRDKSYFDSVLADGLMTDGKYYLSGELAEFSDGEMSNGKTYVSGFLAQGGMADGKYYFDGRLAQFADGPMTDDKYYINGLAANGTFDPYFYLNGIRVLAVYGCVDDTACNYNPSANTTDFSCNYACVASTTSYSADNPDDHVFGDGDHAVADSTIYLPGNYGSPLLFRVGEYVWAFSTWAGNGVWRVHRQTDSVTDFVGTLPSPINAGASSEGLLWILKGTTLYKIDGNSGAIITTLDLSGTIQTPRAIAVDSTKIGITGDSNLVFFDKSTLSVIRTVNLPSSDSGFDPTLAYVLREGAGGWFTATGGDRSSIYRYDYATDSGRFLDVVIDSIEGIARDATGFWIPNTHNYIEAAYLYHIKFDGTVDRRLNMDLYYGFNPDWFQGYWYPKTHIAPGGRVWQINYSPFRLLIMDWMSDGSSPAGT
ncbi:MAG: hypothetical protein EBZ49_07325, partial [Proteobacteria bacterium]|nr:hypothetical protein [Pseudomonadota bacterium]